jgi:hypothetical protein
MIVMWFGWIAVRRLNKQAMYPDCTSPSGGVRRVMDVVDLGAIDLKSDEYEDTAEDDEEEALRQKRISQGRRRFLWRIYYLAA